MEHAITIGDIVKWGLISIAALGGVAAVGYVVLVLLNPFSSGH